MQSKNSLSLFVSLLLLLSTVFLDVSSCFAADTGPLEIGTRLLVQDQVIVQSLNNLGCELEIDEVGEDLGSSCREPFLTQESLGDGHAAVMGGCVKKEKDERFLFSVGVDAASPRNGRFLTFLKTDALGKCRKTYMDHWEYDFFPPEQGPDGTAFVDVAASDWNGDGYPDFAVLYLSWNGEGRAYSLIVVDGKPDKKGHFTLHEDDAWSWTLQQHDEGGLAQGRIAVGDVDDDGRDELVVYVGNRCFDGQDDRNTLGVYEIGEDLILGEGVEVAAGVSAENWDALDVTVGDFRGTGKFQIATISSNRCEVSAKVWETCDGPLRQVADLGTVGELPKNTSHAGYLRCVAGDLDGNGRDEFVWAGGDRHTDSGKIAVVVHANLDTGGDLNFFKSAVQYPLESDPGHPVFDLAVGPFANGVIPSESETPGQMQIALAVRPGYYSVMGWDGEAFRQGPVYVFHAYWNDWNRPCYQYPVIVAGDLKGKTLLLGDPEYYEVVNQLSPVVVMQAPPRHWDRIGSRDVDAFSAYGPYKTSFSLENSSTETAESSTQSSVSMACKETFDQSFNFLDVMKTKFHFAFSQSMKDAEDSLAREKKTSTMKLNAEAATDDWIYYTFQNLRLWRYPILGRPGEEAAEGVTTDRLYYQVVYPGSFTTKMSGGRDKEWYAPIHENQNLLSYPSRVDFIQDYPAQGSGGILYGGPDNLVAVTVGADVSGTRSNSFSSVSFEQEKASHSVSNGFDESVSMSNKVFCAKLDEAVSTKFDGALSHTETNSVNLSNAVGFTTAVPEGSGYIFKDGRTAASAMFDLYETAFLTEGKKTLVAGYAVDLLGSDSGSLWKDPSTSPYRQLPDPALSLPQKWELQTTVNPYGAKGTRWVLSESETARKKIRGGFALLADEYGSYDNSRPELVLTMDDPGTVRLRCRIHNYSFVESGSVDVRFSYIFTGDGSGLPTDGQPMEIDTVTLDRIPAWTREGVPNFELAEVDWNTWHLGDSAQGCYWILVEIDPDDVVAEIHDNGDEAGNNVGWFQIGLVKKDTLESLAGDYLDDDFKAAAGIMKASDSDLEDVSLSMDDFDAGEGETTLVRGVVANRGDVPMALTHVDFFEWTDGEWRLFDEEIVPLLMPGQKRTLEIPFTPSSSESNVKMVAIPRLGEADFENNSMEIVRSSGDGCSIAPFPGMVLVLPLLLLLKR